MVVTRLRVVAGVAVVDRAFRDRIRTDARKGCAGRERTDAQRGGKPADQQLHPSIVAARRSMNQGSQPKHYETLRAQAWADAAPFEPK
jgi:hypothetical protein